MDVITPTASQSLPYATKLTTENNEIPNFVTQKRHTHTLKNTLKSQTPTHFIEKANCVNHITTLSNKVASSYMFLFPL